VVPPQTTLSGQHPAKEFPMQRFSNDGSAQVSQNNAEESLAPAEAQPAEQPAPALAFTPLAAKDRAPGLAVRTQLKAGYLKMKF
jgi:hypothetical protein